MSLTVVPLDPNDRRAAACLLASRHAADRRRERDLSARFESPEETLPLIDDLLDAPAATGVMAWRDGQPAGFLAGLMRAPSPLSFGAKFLRPRSAIVPYHGHALAAGEDAELYRELYASLSQVWVNRGYFSHYVEVPALDFMATEAFVSLGFGRDNVAALRAVAEEVEAAPVEAVTIRRADQEDLETVLHLGEWLAAHHASAPSFLPFLREPDAEIARMAQTLLADPANAHFVAERDGIPVGMQTFMAPEFLSLLARPERCIYLFEGIVTPEARRGGIGRELLRHSMAWAREAGFASCALHFMSGNLAGARFWQSNGFRPLTFRLARQVDERIAWAT